ncbi:hypothetical protein CPC735_042110 [Coccidioides posadasii C735 delta SOWgp]|uniref:Methyltransferase n=1 Tax=Coccidioides posadasii (strain C735) TaxID=222929 RepID=C5PAY3_COCP7|nr:hypothetical protein CPC735_042110 [Coccidioides posadasii C735 delta SOWgp]EER25767.1 hypothetical protein CPC735_042110 [Coccidioides posadasii C735 delta SOWgp]|eukprot:XP_003067912.1 hypothetical protein CPC735_042110 [Coccidioides posadasii C735 delta SOWgp]
MDSLSPEYESDLRIFAAQYFQVVDAQSLIFPSNPVLIKPAAQKWVYQNMFNEDVIWPIPPASYRMRVLKALLSRIEDSIMDPEEDEISDDLMACWGDLVARPKRPPLEEAQDLSYIKYSPPGTLGRGESQAIVTSENRGLILSSGTTGFRTWEAALHQGTYLSTPAGRAVVSGKNIVELGAGTGLVSMYCLKYLGAKRVVATDREPALISNIEDCVVRNNLDCSKFHSRIWEWGRPLELPDDSGADHPTTFDVALGSDLVCASQNHLHVSDDLKARVHRTDPWYDWQIYDADLIPVLLSTLRELFENYGLKVFLISATLRNRKTFAMFLKSCGVHPCQSSLMYAGWYTKSH